MTQEELAILGRKAGESLPDGGQKLRLRHDSGHQSGHQWAAHFGELFREEFGIGLFAGTFNLYSNGPIAWPAPQTFSRAEAEGFEFCPVVIEERAVGIAMRKGTEREDFLEVLSPVELRERLNASRGDAFAVRLLPGSALHRAALPVAPRR